MTGTTDPFSHTPADTVHTTRSVFNIENLYLVVGDSLDALLGDIEWIQLDAFGDSRPAQLFLLAMVTAFQYAEKLSDQPAADALRERTDWKYALQLPLDYPGLDPAELAGFRRRLRDNADGRQVLQQVLAQLAQVGLLGRAGKSDVTALDVLRDIDCLNRVEQAAEAMSLALESLAATRPEWLQANSLPHWVERYSPQNSTRRRPILEAEGQDRLEAYKTDITYLLGAIASSGATDLARMPEIQTLQALSSSGERGPRDVVS